MGNKKGISAIVATVLTVLITVAGVAIIWLAIVPMINENIAFEGLDGRVTVVTTGGYTVYDADEDVAIVQVKRDVDEGTMDRIKVSFLIEGETVSSNVVAPGSGQAKTYAFDLSGYGEPEGIEVAPIFVRGEQEKEGSVTSKVDMPSGDIIEDVNSIEFKAKTYDLEDEYYGDYSEIPTNGLIGWWRFSGDFNETVNDIEMDVEGGGINTNNNVLNLNGVDDYLSHSSTSFLDLATLKGDYPDEVSVSAWIMSSDIVGRHDIYTQNGPILFYSRDGKITGGIYAGSPVWTEADGEIGILENVWNHVFLVYNGNKIKLFINGELDKEVDKSGDLGSANAIIIGDYNTHTSGYQFDGLIDNVMVYDRGLSDAEVTAIYESQRK